MPETHTSTTNDTAPAGTPFLSRRRRTTGYALDALAVVLAGLAVWMFWLARDETRHWPCIWTGVWLAVVAMLSAGVGVFLSMSDTDANDSAADGRTRISLLTAGAAAGLATVFLAGILVYLWWPSVSGGLKTWRHEAWRLVACASALFGGLAIMFASLQLARAGERTVPWMRKVLYGFNTALTALLVLAILGVVNVLTYVPIQPFKVFNTVTDWTSASLFSLSDSSKSLLASLDKPVKIYALLQNDEITSSEMKALLDNCRNVNDKIEVEYVTPELNPNRFNELSKKYALTEPFGLLLLYGTEPHEEHEFIKLKDMFPTGDRPNEVRFAGESVLVQKLSALSQHHAKAVIYFTQGNGEPDLNNTTERAFDEGIGVLKQRLEHRDYQVKSVRLDATAKVPDDAAVVVVARPTNPGLSVQALEDYMNPKDKKKKPGKLIVLEDVTLGTDGRIVHTPVDDFLAKAGVQVKDNRLLNRNVPSVRLVEHVRVITNPELRTTNPVARAFKNLNTAWQEVRTVEPAPTGSGPSHYGVVALLKAVGPTINQLNLRQDPLEYLANLIQPENAKQYNERENKDDVPVAVAATVPRGPAGDPHARLAGQEPRMVVFGDTSWITNPYMMEASGAPSYDLFTSTLAWLQDRADVGVTAESKEHKIYAPQISSSTETYLDWVPLTLMLVGVVGLGGGIWVVRRR